MERIQFTGGRKQGNHIILEPEDWTEDEWAIILKLFGLQEAESITLMDYNIVAYGIAKTHAEALE